MDKHSNKFITIVIPTFNSSYFIDRTLESIFNQTSTNFDLIISDDGLIETRTIVYDSAGSANDFRLDEVAVENQQLRHEWCKTNNVKFSFTMDED